MSTLTKNLAFAFTLAIGATITGCAADSPDDDPNNPDNPDNPDNPSKQLDASGKYQMRSSFDLATNAPGKVGDVTRAIIDMTDSPEDPTLWVLDQLIAKMDSGTFKNVLNSSKSFIAGYLNDRVLDFAPDFVSTFVQVGQDFGQIAKNFGLNETLEVSKGGAGYIAIHTALGAHFKIDNIESDHNFADFQVANIVTADVGVTLDQTGNLGIADHKLNVTLGKVLRVGMDGAIIPMIDPTAHNLGELLVHKVDCARVGVHIRDAIASVIGYGGSASTYQAACVAGLQGGAGFLYSKINAIDSSALEFGLTGQARGLDKNGDKMIDSIQTGAWTGNISYAGTPAPLAGATFYAERM
jgi:hypothetical protein